MVQPYLGEMELDKDISIFQIQACREAGIAPCSNRTCKMLYRLRKSSARATFRD